MKKVDPRSHPLVARLDLILLGTIGLGAIAWYARSKFFGASSDKTASTSSSTTINSNATPKPAPSKPERNFVKVMQQQVTNFRSLLPYQVPSLLPSLSSSYNCHHQRP